jgi:hypothetical protein
MNEAVLLRYLRIEQHVAGQRARRRLSSVQDPSDRRAGDGSGSVTPPDAA